MNAAGYLGLTHNGLASIAHNTRSHPFSLDIPDVAIAIRLMLFMLFEDGYKMAPE